MKKLKIDAEDVIVFHDDLDLEIGKIIANVEPEDLIINCKSFVS